MDGNFNKVSDNDLPYVIDHLEPFMEYAAIRNSTKTRVK
jgi:hypothetical protein